MARAFSKRLRRSVLTCFHVVAALTLQGIAYAEAMAAAGVPVEQLQARGHFHASFTMVDVVITAVSGRATMADCNPFGRHDTPPRV